MISEKSAATAKPPVSRVEVYWHTVKYRTVLLYAIVLATIGLTFVYLVFPEFSADILHKVSDAVGHTDKGVAANISARQARFVNLDGRVQVKKVNSVQWMNADYQTTLDKGDLIQTGSEGVARIAFGDGTTYTVKGDTLVTVEENIVASGPRLAGRSAHQFGPGGFGDRHMAGPGIQGRGFLRKCRGLSAGKQPRGSAQRAATNQQEITVDAGSAELSRGNDMWTSASRNASRSPTGGADDEIASAGAA